MPKKQDPRDHHRRRDRHRRAIARGRPPCHLCGNEIDYGITDHLGPLAFTIDHVIPIAKGGADHIDNLAAAHRRCNSARQASIKRRVRPAVTFVTERTWTVHELGGI